MRLFIQVIPVDPLLLIPSDWERSSGGVPVDRPGHICVCALARVRSANIVIRSARRSPNHRSPSDNCSPEHIKTSAHRFGVSVDRIVGEHKLSQPHARAPATDRCLLMAVLPSVITKWIGTVAQKIAVRVLPLTFRCLPDPLWP
jgi:hypothetical protein